MNEPKADLNFLWFEVCRLRSEAEEGRRANAKEDYEIALKRYEDAVEAASAWTEEMCHKYDDRE